MTGQIDDIKHWLNADARPSSDYDLNPDVVLPEGRKIRPAAVLVPLIERKGALQVILTKRSSALKHHPGQIAFPGGKQDESDLSLEAAALREAYEEIALPPDSVGILGTLPNHETVTGFGVTPVVGHILEPFQAFPGPGEVDEIFHVPLSYLSDTANFQVQSRRWRGTRRAYYTVPFGPYYIWGATARILKGLADRRGS